jgi:hypothetical protein
MTAGFPDRADRLLAARAHLDAVRAPRAAGPRADREALRTAYLELLKLALCDLVGAGTTSVGAADGNVIAREIEGDGSGCGLRGWIGRCTASP